MSPGRARVEEVGLEISDGPGSGLEAVPDGPVMRGYEELKVGMGSGAPEIQGLEEKTGRGGEAIVR